MCQDGAGRPRREFRYSSVRDHPPGSCPRGCHQGIRHPPRDQASNRVRPEGLDASERPDYFAPRSEVGSTIEETPCRSLFLPGSLRSAGRWGASKKPGGATRRGDCQSPRLRPRSVAEQWLEGQRPGNAPVFSGWIPPVRGPVGELLRNNPQLSRGTKLYPRRRAWLRTRCSKRRRFWCSLSVILSSS